MKNSWLLASITFILCFLNSQAFSASPQTLKQLLSSALEHSITLDSKRREVQIKQTLVTNKSILNLPQVNLTSKHGLEKNFPEEKDTPWVSNIGISISENFYDSGRSFSELEISTLEFRDVIFPVNS